MTHKTVHFIWINQCQKAFETLKDALIKSLTLVYPDPNKPYPLFMDASKYAWSTVFTQEHTIVNDHHPITYVGGLFNGSQ